MTIASITPSASGARTLGLEDFMKVLLTQLTFQDPLKPMDNQAFMAQMAQFSALEQSQQLNERMQLLVDNQAALQSVALLGRTVEVTSDGARATGTVTAMSLQGDAPLLTLSLTGGGVMNDVALSRIVAIR